jgi:2-iminobutanoate/2-iminopropanoate deaminase
MKTIIATELAPKAVGTYSQGVSVGNTYYFSGQIGLDPKTMEMVDGFKNQINQVLKNIEGLLTSQNLNKENIVKTTVFVTDLNNFAMVNEAYEGFFKPPYPARSTVQVSKLPKDALVEIEIIATK